MLRFNSSIHTVNVPDTMIAAHALSLKVTIVTNNIRLFERVPDLRLENWAATDHP